MQSPQLQLYNKVFDIGRGYGLKVITEKMMTEEVAYPFLVVKDTDERLTKFTFERFDGEVTVQAMLFSKSDDRGLHDDYIHKIKMTLAELDRTENYIVMLNDIQTNTMTYTETNQELIQTNLLIEYKIY